MSKKKPYIKWYMDICDNPLFLKKPFSDWQAFEYLCLKCRRFPTDLVLDDGTIIHLATGQYFISRANLADICGWSVKKLRAWEKRTKQLKMVTAEGKARGTLYTVENYVFHQIEGQAKGQGKGQPEGTSEGQHTYKDKESIKKDARVRDLETPREVIPMPDYIRKKIEKVF